jgi:hypothetical protein
VSFIINPYRFTAPVGGLDLYTTNLWAVYGLKRLLTAYAGSCIRVRRSNDDAEADIGFVSSAVGAAIDATALAAHVGANSGYIVTRYDQSGGGNHFTQATKTAQPRIVDAGVYDTFSRYDGSDDFLESVNSISATNKITAFHNARRRASTNQDTLFGNKNTGTGNGWSGYAVAASVFPSGFVGTSGFTNYEVSEFSGNTLSAGQLFAWVFDRTIAYPAKMTMWVNGTPVTRTNEGIVGAGVSSSNFSVDTVAIARSSTPTFAGINEIAFALYLGDKTADMAAISSALA